MPETCVRHEEALAQMKRDSQANTDAHRELKDILDRVDEAIRGNGSPGIRTQISRIKLQVGVLWGLFISAALATVGFVVNHFLGDRP